MDSPLEANIIIDDDPDLRQTGWPTAAFPAGRSAMVVVEGGVSHMTRTSYSIAVLGVLAVAFGCSSSSSPSTGPSQAATDAAGSSVVIERSEEAYIVLIRTPDASKEAVDEIKAGSSGARVFEVVRWEVFTATITEIVNSVVRKNEYPARNVSLGMTDLLARHPGVPFGLTWTGGVAFTFNDYQHTKQIHEQWKADPVGYERSRPSSDPRLDPIAPQHHFLPLLGKAY